MLQKLSIVTLIFVILGGGFWYYESNFSTTETKPEANRSITSELDTEKLTNIVIRGSEETVELVKGADSLWKVSSFDYQANTKKIHDLFYQLINIKLGEEVTTQAKHHERFHLLHLKDNNDQWQAEKTGSLIQLKQADGTTPLGLLLGKNRSDKSGYKQGQYIRYEDNPSVFLISENVNLDTNSADWLDKDLLDVDGRKLVKTVEVQRGEETFRFSREKEEDPWVINGMIVPEKVNESGVDSLSGAISNLDFETLKPHDTTDATGRATLAYFTAELFDGKIIKATIGEEKTDDHYYMSITMDLRNDVTDDTLKKEVESFNQRTKPWLYALKSWVGERFLKERSDLFIDDKEQNDSSQ